MKLNGTICTVVLAGAVAACQDHISSPTAPSTVPARFSSAGDQTGNQPGQIGVQCTAWRKVGQEWQTRQLTIFFPGAELAPDGAAFGYDFKGYTNGADLVARAVCTVPRTGAALQRIERFFGVARPRPTGGNPEDARLMEDTDTPMLEGVEGVACQYGGDYYSDEGCNSAPEPSDADCIWYSDCTGGGGWSGGEWDGSGGESGGSTSSEFPDTGDDDIAVDTIPDCTQAQIENWKRAYCRSTAPEGTRLTRTNEAFNRIEQRGVECANIVSFGRQLLGDGRLRYFDYQEGDKGGWGDPAMGALIASYWVDDLGGSNFERVLVHEIEHAMGREHTTPNETPNSRFCSGSP